MASKSFILLLCGLCAFVFMNNVSQSFLGASSSSPLALLSAADYYSFLPQAESSSSSSSSSSKNNDNNIRRRRIPASLRCSRKENDLLTNANFWGSHDDKFDESSYGRNERWKQRMVEFDHESRREEPSSHSNKYTAISIGCNKGTEAIATARLLTNDPVFDGATWYASMTKLAGVQDLGNNIRVGGDQVVIEAGQPKFGIEMHCIEPLPGNTLHLQHASRDLDLVDRGFQTHPYAISLEAGSTELPVNVPAGAGTESFVGADPCKNSRDKNIQCQNVQVLSLDDFAARHVSSSQEIDFLQIEGSDFQSVLKGGQMTIKRTRFIQYGYHHKEGMPGNHRNLKDAINVLDESGFTCYLMTAYKNQVFKLTGCSWASTAHMEQQHVWSNAVGCVHRSEVGWMSIMESVFLETIYDPSKQPSSEHHPCRTTAKQRASRLPP